VHFKANQANQLQLGLHICNKGMKVTFLHTYTSHSAQNMQETASIKHIMLRNCYTQNVIHINKK